MSATRRKPQVDTFPFLAVLLCAMGALIVVLLTMDRKARLVARAKAEGVLRKQSEERESAIALARREQEKRYADLRAAWQIRQDALRKAVDAEDAKLDTELREVRTRLADASRRLAAELEQLRSTRTRLANEKTKLNEAEATLAAAQNQAANEMQRIERTEAARTKLAANLESMERTLKDIEADRQRDTNTYSLIPYHGKRGANQRPVYVECADKGLIFHPDKTRIPHDETKTLRAEVTRRLSASGARPYLMLLVRPNGIESYYRVRASVSDLDVLFGYEMVDADWQFHIPDEPPPVASGATETGPQLGSRGSSTPGVIIGKSGAASLMPRNTPELEAGERGVSTPQKNSGVDTPRSPSLPQQRTDAVAMLKPKGVNPPLKTPLGGSVNLDRPRPFANEEAPLFGSSSASRPGGSNPDGSMPAGPVFGVPTPSAANLPTNDRPAGADSQTRPSATVQNRPPQPDGRPSIGQGEPNSETPSRSFNPYRPAAPVAPTTGAIAPHQSQDNDSSRMPITPPAGLRPKPQDDREPLRAARVDSNELTVYIECCAGYAVIYPGRKVVMRESITSGALLTLVKQGLTRPVPGGGTPKAQVRFLVRPVGEETFHNAIDALRSLKVPMSQYRVQPDDDILRLVGSH